jgi:phosphoenolpyruvate carboxykinase (GTP)
MTMSLGAWVDESAKLTQPDRIVWCDGSEAESGRLTEEMLRDGTLIELNQKSNPGCYLHRSNPSDVARTEHLTFIASERREDAGPTNNWLSPAQARERLVPLFRGSMRGRTMYVVPYLMGPAGSPFSRVGVELTDSAYVVASLRIMTRMGRIAMDQLDKGNTYAPGLHSLGDLHPDRRFIVHFPGERLVWSIGSGYGGNALLSKKCFALRIAGVMAQAEGWMAEHMLIMGIEDSAGQVTYVAAAFPSACGKTNLSMLIPPSSLPGYKIWTIGDDIAWLRVGRDGRLWAINPEAGFFGVAPGTGPESNPNAMATLNRNSLLTNVAMTPDRKPWWEGIGHEPPPGLVDWQGRLWSKADGGTAAHPNSRFTAPARQCPTISPKLDDPSGVPISAIVFGGRRARVAPLVLQARDWEHGVFVGASMASETTTAATGAVGVLRRDPMAMLPFCGYNMGDYFTHWLSIGRQLSRPPAVFHVNWFRRNSSGKFLWPGFGENLRVLLWIIERVNSACAGEETPIGVVPRPNELHLDGAGVTQEAMREVLSVDRTEWDTETAGLRQFLAQFGDRLPQEMSRQTDDVSGRLGRTTV